MIEATAKLLAEMPRQVRVGSYDFQIVNQPEPMVENGEVSYGDCSLQTQTITIVVDDTTTKKQVVGLLIHEILHAMWDDRNLKKRPAEEDVVLAYEYGWVNLFRDNPKLISWMKKGLK